MQSQPQDRFKSLFDQSPVTVQIHDPKGTLLSVNQAWRKMSGMSDADIDAHVIGKYNMLTDPQAVRRGLAQLAQKAYAGEVVVIPPVCYDPSENGLTARMRWIAPILYPIKDAQGTVTEVVLLQEDVTERKTAEETMRLVAEASALFEITDCLDTLVQKLSALAVKWFGGWCEIHWVGAGGALELKAVHPPGRDAFFDPTEVVRTRHARVIKAEPNAAGVRSLMSLPLVDQGVAFGAITMVTTERVFGEEFFALAQELASRASLALQNYRLLEATRRALKLRDEFLSVTSHELKTPLTPLLMQVQAIKMLATQDRLAQVPASTVLELVSTAEDHIRRMVRQVDDLLEVSRIRADKILLERSQVEMETLIQDVVNENAAALRNAGCTVQVSGGAAPPVDAYCDATRVRRVLSNLLSNAIKFAPGTAIEIAAHVQGDDAIVSVCDRGIGIAEGDQQRIFERFERAVSDRHFGGVGLGLYIAREYVAAHGGALKVESLPGQGARFELRLPRKSP